MKTLHGAVPENSGKLFVNSNPLNSPKKKRLAWRFERVRLLYGSRPASKRQGELGDCISLREHSESEFQMASWVKVTR